MQQLEKTMPRRVEVAAIIKKAILSGEYKSGDELGLTQIAEQLGISRTPVREAFQTLAGEGLITLRMNRGAVVNQIDRKFVRDNFEMRILLESEAAARAASNAMDVSSLYDRLCYMRDNLENVSESDYKALNQELHMAIWNAADNEKLKHYLMELWNGPSTGHSISESIQHYKNSTYEHISIVNAIRDHDPACARKAMTQHIARSMENILKFYQ